MALERGEENDDDNNTPLTLEEAFAVYDRLSFLHPSGPPPASLLRRLGPTYAAKMYYGRETLLHRCCKLSQQHGGQLELVKILVQLYPEALEVYDHDGKLPLHYAVTSPHHSHPSLPTILYLIEQGPLALLQATRDDRRAIPLHLAVGRPECTAEIVEALLQLFPETIHYKNAAGDMPLQCAIRTFSVGRSLDQVKQVIKTLVNAAPVLLSFVHERTGNLVLHDIISEHSDSYDDIAITTTTATKTTTANIILDDEDKDAYEHSGSSRSRHHCRGHATTSLLELCLEAFSGALRVQNSDRYTPLVLACKENLSVDCVYTLLRAWPEQVTTQRQLIIPDDKDEDDYDEDELPWNGVLLPTQLLNHSSGISWRDVQRWVHQDAQAARTTDAAGRYPLHYAVLSHFSWTVKLVKLLLNHFPAAAQHADQWGRLPLHYLALSTHHGRREDILELFVEDSSLAKGLVKPDKEGCLPWMYGELVQFIALYEATAEFDASAMDSTVDLPAEARWDIAQVLPDEIGD